MRRRVFTRASAAVALAWPLDALAQPTDRLRRIGLLSNDAHTSANAIAFWSVVRKEMERYGWSEGKTVAFELASHDGFYDRLPTVVRELIERKIELIIVPGGIASQAVKAATSTIPAVFVGVSDPVRAGLVASLARPGGNMTGLSNLSNDLIAKRLQFLKEVSRGATRVAYLTYEVGVTWPDEEAARVAAALGLQWQEVRVMNQADLASAIAGQTDAQAWFVGDPVLIFDRAEVVRLLAAHRKPVVYPNSTFARAGGLLSYGVNNLALARRAAWYVDRILRGAKPADIPVEQPTTFELVINLRTARALGLDIPPTLLGRADEVID